jgi:hypothetical protein
MEVLIHFGFEILKISMQSIFYNLLLFLVVFHGRFKWQELFRKFNPKVLCLGLMLLCCWIGLFTFLFSYWGNHGLGDTSRIPIGYGEEIMSFDGSCEFDPQQEYHGEQFEFENFSWNSKVLTGRLKQGILVFDLATKQSIKIDEASYQSEALTNGWPPLEEFKSFFSNYQTYWGTWRFLLLP